MATLLAHPLWTPASLPQIEALLSPADVLGYGGAAGGGKTDLLLGAALTMHRRAVIYRREGPQLEGLEDRSGEIVGDAGRFTRQRRTWTLRGRLAGVPGGRKIRSVARTVRFGAVPRPGDWKKFQGRPFDLVGFDEAANFLELQVRMLMTWNRTTVPGQRCRVILAFNPPTDTEGFWIIDYFGPWLDRNHPNPAKPGELRWFVSIDRRDVEVPGPEPVEHEGKVLRPKSRTFVPARVEDNAFLAGSDYEATLDMLPEPLRSAFRHGDFAAMQQDNAFQVIPTDWIKAAQARWRPDGGQGKPMDALGLDIARGGQDKTILSPRHGVWFAELQAWPGSATPNGPLVAGLAVGAVKDGAPIQLDVIGVGASVYDHLEGAGVQVVGLNGAAKSHARDKSGRLGFANLRAELWWKFREALDPVHGDGLALPPDRELLADMAAPRWTLTSSGILIEGKDELIKRIGRSPDRGDAVVYANRRTMKVGREETTFARSEYDPRQSFAQS
ncbi:phage terminase large subunit [Magnetospirillum fulvum]|uniref:Phage terminase large subunit n=1 Tax=Magnetospirillum fulvum MGU-K5 TaxID=1316936 RepID=S9TYV2_MAGFU|nr:phage terminase large subunit [Magnetospirillum fulvum]EPY03500.1 phage terminase large subunit [Magnetospirillum fulvum MGU-K5]